MDREIIRRRAKAIRLVITDVDGVLTDAGVYYSATGEAMKRFNVRDGMGVELLRESGIATAILTREDSPIVAHRAAKLRIELCCMGIRDKRAHLSQIARDSRCAPSEMAYMGDDINDLGILESIAESGLTAAPRDAHRRILPRVHYISQSDGGHGAFRDFADWLLAQRAEEET